LRRRRTHQNLFATRPGCHGPGTNLTIHGSRQQPRSIVGVEVTRRVPREPRPQTPDPIQLSGCNCSNSRVKWGARASRARRPASRRMRLGNVRNGTLQTATGTVALPSTMFSTSSVQPRTPINREQALSGFDAAEVTLDTKRYLPKMAVVNQGAMLQHIPAD
jgi:hypothetical protein